MIGKERLLNAPAQEIETLGAGVPLLLGADPEAWSTPEYKTAESGALAYLGEKYFCNRREPRRETTAPDLD